MESKEFIRIRRHLGKTQNQLAELLCISPKAVQSFEQGWRKIPASAERQLLVLLSMTVAGEPVIGPCWEVKECRDEWKEKCMVWEFRIRYFCWLLNGTYCEGVAHKIWQEKIERCRDCPVFHRTFSPVIDTPPPA